MCLAAIYEQQLSPTGDSHATGALTNKHNATNNDVTNNYTINILNSYCFTGDGFSISSADSVNLMSNDAVFVNSSKCDMIPYMLGLEDNDYNPVYGDEKGCDIFPRPVVLCTHCKQLTQKSYEKLHTTWRRVFCVVVVYQVFYVLHRGSVLFWFTGRTRRKLLLLLGLTTGKYYG